MLCRNTTLPVPILALIQKDSTCACEGEKRPVLAQAASLTFTRAIARTLT
jgi:hypothetical protein